MESVGLDMDDVFAEREDFGDVEEDYTNSLPNALPDLEDLPENADDQGEDGEESGTQVLSKLKDLKGAAKKVVQRPQPKLDPERLTGQRGIPVLPKVFKDVKFKGKGHETEDLKKLMSTMEHWAHRLFPKMPFDDVLERIEKLGAKKPVQTCVKRMRLDMPLLDEDFTSRQGDEDAEENKDDDDDDKENNGVNQDVVNSVFGRQIPDDDDIPGFDDDEDVLDDMLRDEHSQRPSSPSFPGVPRTPKTPATSSASTDNDPRGSSLTPGTPALQVSTPKSPASVSKEQQERMERNRRLAMEKRAKKFGTPLPVGLSSSQASQQDTGSSQPQPSSSQHNFSQESQPSQHTSDTTNKPQHSQQTSDDAEKLEGLNKPQPSKQRLEDDGKGQNETKQMLQSSCDNRKEESEKVGHETEARTIGDAQSVSSTLQDAQKDSIKSLESEMDEDNTSITITDKEADDKKEGTEIVEDDSDCGFKLHLSSTEEDADSQSGVEDNADSESKELHLSLKCTAESNGSSLEQQSVVKGVHEGHTLNEGSEDVCLRLTETETADPSSERKQCDNATTDDHGNKSAEMNPLVGGPKEGIVTSETDSADLNLQMTVSETQPNSSIGVEDSVTSADSLEAAPIGGATKKGEESQSLNLHLSETQGNDEENMEVD